MDESSGHSKGHGSRAGPGSPTSNSHDLQSALSGLAAPSRHKTGGESLNRIASFIFVLSCYCSGANDEFDGASHAGSTGERGSVLAMEQIRDPTMEDLRYWKGKIGQKLRSLLATQESQHPPVRCCPILWPDGN